MISNSSFFLRMRWRGAFGSVIALLLLAGSPVHAQQIVINEILQNPSAVSDSAGEWFELHNPSGTAVDIEGWMILDNDFDSHVIANGGPLVIPAGGFLVLANNSDTSTNGGVSVDYDYGTGFFLANGADELVLLDGTSTEIDRVEWDGGPAFPDPNGASMSLVSPSLDNNVGANWCTASTPFGAGDFGTPGAANDCPSPNVVINEILQNPSAVADSAGEWFEVHNPGATPVDVNGWTIRDNDFDSHVIANGGPLVIPAGGFLVLANNSDTSTNGGVSVDYDYGTGFFLGNGSDELVLLDLAANEVDRVEWDNGATFPDPNGASMSLVNPALDNNVGANWCEGSTPFGAGDLGTPGTVNDCPVTNLGIVINEILQNPAAVSDSAGEWFELHNPTGTAVDIDGWMILDNDFDSHVIANGGPLVIPAGGFLVLANNSDTSTNGGVSVDYDYGTGFFLANGADELVLLDGTATEIDRVEWDNGATFPDPNGASMALKNPLLDNNVGANWCTGSTPFGAGDQGTPGAVNDCGLKLRINEIDYDQPGADTAEFIEIKNTGTEPADLSTATLELINGFNGSVYGSFPLPAVTLAPGDYFVVCTSAATVPNCDFDVLSSIQNGAPDAVALTEGGLLIDAVSYEGDTVSPYTEGSGSGLEDSGAVGQDNRGISRFPDGTDTGQNNVDLVNSCITPGRANSSLDANCGPLAPTLEIFEIQGAGSASAVADQGTTTPDNIVTAVGLDGFFIQTPQGRQDGDVNTSDGIFVFTGGAPGVAVGDAVDVTGTVREFFGFTEFSDGPDVTILSSGNPLPAAVQFDATTPSPDPAAPSCAIEFECYEGMLVEIADGTVVGPNQRFTPDPVAEVHIVATPDRAFREPGIAFPGLPSLPVWDGNPEVFELDPDRLGLANATIPAGSTFSATGVLGFEFGGYELWPTTVNVTPAPLPVAVRARNAGEFTVGTLNLFRLFDDVNDPPSTGATGLTRDDAVVSTAEYLRRRAKLAAYIVNVLLAPDVLAVQEAEKLEVLQDLAADINGLDPSVSYTAYLVEGNDVGTIDNGYLVRDTIAVDAVTQLGFTELLTFDGSPLHDRPPLLLEGRCIAGGADFPIVVMNLHNRSLGGIDSPSSGPRVRQKRLEQAQSVATKVQALQDADPDVHLVVIGDLNAFEFTDGYVDVTGQIRGNFVPTDNLLSGVDLVDPDLLNQVEGLEASERYSFIFRGSAQTLDHSLTAAGLDIFVRGAQFGRGNADAAFDLINDDATLLRASDHDGLVQYLMKDTDGDTIPDDMDLCPNTEIPEGVPTVQLGINRWALVDGDTIFDTRFAPRGVPDRTPFTIGQTGGCSCEQIIDQLGLGAGQIKFGCSRSNMDAWIESIGAPPADGAAAR